MARRRFFVEEIREGAAKITGDDAAHLTRVLRVEKGERFEISDNSDVWLAEVAEARKSLVEFRVIERLDAGLVLPEVHLYAALFKFDRFEWMIEKATELGATRIVPVETQRSDHGLFAAAEKRVERWRKIARESSQQSRRARMAKVDGAVKMARVNVGGERILLDEAPGTPPMKIAADGHAESPLSLFIGPEGGWTDNERAGLTESGWIAASLGPTILRAETAAVAALSIVTHALRAHRLDAGR